MASLPIRIMEYMIDYLNEDKKIITLVKNNLNIKEIDEYKNVIKIIQEKSKLPEIKVKQYINSILYLIHTLSIEDTFSIDEFTVHITRYEEFRVRRLLKKKKQIPINKEIIEFAFLELLSNENLIIIAKSNHFGKSTNRFLLDSRIFADFRPIFSKNINDPPVHGIILHNLELDYYDNGRKKTEQFSISTKQLKWLGKMIERELNKKDTIIADYSRRGFKILGDEDDD
jgi:hypothetical protein